MPWGVNVGDFLQREFTRFSQFLSDIDPDHIDSYKNEFFSRIQKIAKIIEEDPDQESAGKQFYEICGLIDESPLHQRTRHKPMGYAGDFLLIDWIYTQKIGGSRIGRFFDQLFHSYEAAAAVRNRKDFFIRKCNELANTRKKRVDVLDIGCGSCRDVIEAHSVCDNGTQFYYHCVDHEEEAINYASELLAGSGISERVKLDCTNAFKISTDKEYDLIWSAGFFDYLNNRTASLLIRKMWRNLKPGGQFIFGNFSPKNPTRAGMELIGHWYLIHRSAHELIALCEETGIQYASIHIESEPLGVNLFCVLTK